MADWKPPNPLPVESAVQTVFLRLLGRVVEVALGIPRLQLAVGGTIPRSMTSAQAAISIAPIPPREWPIIDLIELIGTL